MKKTILITGCSSGIGKATAKTFAAKGWNVVATMRTPAAHPDLAALDGVMVERLDVQDRASIASAIERGIARFGRIDALVNNAGYGQYGAFEAIPREKIQEQFDVNLFGGVMDTMRAILPHFRANKGGLVMNVSSGAGIYTVPLMTLYCASKFAIEGFTESVHYELASQNIIVKLIVPHALIDETSFFVRQDEKEIVDPALTDYADYIAKIGALFSKVTKTTALTADQVAEVIHGAATDGTTQLRYLIGNNEAGFVHARRTLPEEQYIAYMRRRFTPR